MCSANEFFTLQAESCKNEDKSMLNPGACCTRMLVTLVFSASAVTTAVDN